MNGNGSIMDDTRILQKASADQERFRYSRQALYQN